MRHGSWLVVLVVAAGAAWALWPRSCPVATDPAVGAGAPTPAAPAASSQPSEPSALRTPAAQSDPHQDSLPVRPFRPRASVRGRCVAAEDGTPLAAARVRVSEDDGADGREIAVAADGTFSVEFPDHSLLQVEAEGRVGRIGLAFNAPEWRSADLGDVRLHRGFAVRGRVTDATGQALAGIRLHVRLRSSHVELELPWRRRGPPAVSAGRTDADGSFLLDRVLPAGAWEVEPDAGWLVRGPHVFWVDPVLGAEPLVLVVGRAAEIHGRVVDAQGRGVEHVGLAADPGAARASTDAQGAFRLVSAEPVTGRARIHVLPSHRYERLDQEVSTSWGSHNVVLRAGKPTTCRFAVEVVDDRGQPVPDFRLLLMHADDLDAYCHSYGSHFRCDRRHSSPDGRAVDEDARAGRNVLQVFPVTPGLLRSEPEFLEVRDGQAPTRVELARMKPCTVEVAGLGSTPADVVLIRVGCSIADARRVSSSDDYCIPGAGFPAIRAAEVISHATTRGDSTAELLVPSAGARGCLLRVSGDGLVPVFLLDPALHPEIPLRLTVTACGTLAGPVDLQSPAVAPASVSGRLRTPGAEPWQFEVMLVSLDARDTVSQRVPVTADGRFACTDVLPGRYRLAVLRADRRDRSGFEDLGYFKDLMPVWGRPPAQHADAFTLAPGQDLQREFTFTPRRLILRPRTADGAPVPVCELRVGTWQLHQLECQPLVLDPAPEVAVQVRLPWADAPWSEPVTMPRDRREHEIVVTVPALPR